MLKIFSRPILALLFLASIFSLAAAETPPNVVIILTDDLGYGDIGRYGATDIATPNIDKMAADGLTLTSFYAISPVCSTSRAGLLTGRYPIRMGLKHVFFPQSYSGMPVEEVTIAEILRDADYSTGMVGKWHLGHHPQYLPTEQGFDEFFGLPYSNDMNPLPYIRGNQVVEPRVDQKKMTKRLTYEAIDFIEKQYDKPFFLFVSHPMPHIPIHASPEFKGKSKRGRYGDVIEELDWSTGEIIKTLDEQNILENTLVIFTSDNGAWRFAGKDGGSSGQLRGGKGTTFEGGMRVPGIMMWKDKILPGSVSDVPITMMDLLPTLSTIANAELPEDRVIDGKDVSSVLFKNDEQAVSSSLMSPRGIAYYSHGSLEAYRLGDWKLKRAFKGSNLPYLLRIITPGEIGMGPHEPMLFNLAQDMSETKNLYQAEPDKVAEMEAAMAKFENSLLPLPPVIRTGASLEPVPAVKIMMKVVFKYALICLILLILILVSIAYWLGVWRTKKKFIGKRKIK